MNPTLKRYLVSSITTFTTVFAITVGAQLQAGTITPDNLGWGVVGAVVLTAIRAGVKAVIEAFAAHTGDPATPSA